MTTVCLAAYTLRFPRAGAYAWMFLNWALGLRDLGCRVIWLDTAWPTALPDASAVDDLRARLGRLGLGEPVAVQATGTPLPAAGAGARGLEDALGADLLLNLGYDLSDAVVGRFRRTAFVDIDPGLTQLWMARDELRVARHDVYFTLGERIGGPESPVPTAGIDWVYTPPPVYLPAWRPAAAPPGAAYTTVTNWWGNSDWLVLEGAVLDNSKRAAFLPFLELPGRTSAALELALPLDASEATAEDLARLARHGWRVRDVLEVSATPEAHQAYVRGSRGEFTCMKRGYAELQTGWVGERAVNYLASGKPVVAQHTGPSRLLPDDEGVLRFRTVAEAAARLDAVEGDWDRHSRAARALAEAHFDAVKVTASVLERALG